MEYGHAVAFDDLASVELDQSQPLIYDRPIGVRRLFQDPDAGTEHFLVRYPIGLAAKRHRHTASQTIIVLEGRLQIDDRVIGPGGYCHFPAGETMHHAPAEGESCLLITIFDGPFDVEIAD